MCTHCAPQNHLVVTLDAPFGCEGSCRSCPVSGMARHAMRDSGNSALHMVSPSNPVAETGRFPSSTKNGSVVRHSLGQFLRFGSTGVWAGWLLGVCELSFAGNALRTAFPTARVAAKLVAHMWVLLIAVLFLGCLLLGWLYVLSNTLERKKRGRWRGHCGQCCCPPFARGRRSACLQVEKCSAYPCTPCGLVCCCWE